MNNSATTRMISKIALEYNGNDKGMAKLAAVNFLLGSNPEDQFQEMKIVADRNSKVKKWALTGYISPQEDIGKSLSDEELKDIAIEALKKVGVTDQNQFRLDIHNSTKQKHIHFVVNRMNIHGKCTVKSRKIGERFGEAVRQICQERNLKTDVEIGIEKKAEMLKNLIQSLKCSNNFDELISEMRKRGFLTELSKNEKIGISGMRIILESDINHQTERQYKPGYKLSEITSSLKIAEIKIVFDLKNIVNQELKASSTLKELRDNLYRQGWAMKVQFKNEFRPKQINQVQDIWIKRVATTTTNQQKDGFFYKKYEGFSLSAIGGDYQNIERLLNTAAQLSNQSSIFSVSNKNENLVEIALETVEEILKPNYVSQAEDEWWKKKKKFNR
ncbi:Relaxase/Mobilisation nuclease domain-containing protein [Kaistella chaponensis]|uniref:Relaxase/Mobilisation nuclease domain-containing protein n=1 Tax=Kaistella chaponensis TaxID=713588 RepID=A0A1N7JSX7_9FLAO|nr:relaxase/mobilization nuclease domain-containing protein [Kaistella chaponensis]SIS52371.1 Relaxase/Mobilisation nuclease domain-containing protein [Kaistella chaponensis]